MPKTSIRVDKKLVDEVVKIFNARSRVEAVEMAIQTRFSTWMYR